MISIWNDAPEWANYRTQDSNGRWLWHELKPKKIEGKYWESDGRIQEFFDSSLGKSLEERPKPKNESLPHYDW